MIMEFLLMFLLTLFTPGMGECPTEDSYNCAWDDGDAGQAFVVFGYEGNAVYFYGDGSVTWSR